MQSFDLKLHWSFLLTGSCRDSYNICISFCKTLLSSYFCSQRRIQNSVWHLGWRVMRKYFYGEKPLTMFGGCFVLDVWRGTEYASVTVWKKFLPIFFFFLFFEMLVIETDLTISSLEFFKTYYINNFISNNKARFHKRRKHNVFENQFFLLFSS